MRSSALVVLLCAGGVAHAQVVEPAAPEPAPAVTPAPAPAPAPAEPPSKPATRSAAIPKPATSDCESCTWYLGLEFGAADTADARNIYGDGFGKTLVVGYKHVEFRGLERYDVEDRAGMLGGGQGAFGAKARFTISSVAYRLTLLGHDRAPLAASVLLGGAWVRRPNIRTDDEFEPYTSQTQDGLGAVAGAGIQIYGIVRVEARAYLVRWQDLGGSSRAVYADGTMKTEAVTDSPGGIPLTISVGVGYPF